jgi:hypothetical protein
MFRSIPMIRKFDVLLHGSKALGATRLLNVHEYVRLSLLLFDNFMGKYVSHMCFYGLGIDGHHEKV